MVELMVVLVLLGLMAGVVGLAWRPSPKSGSRDRETISAARREALESGRTVRVQVTVDGETVTIAALPDGSIIAPDTLHLDRLTGLQIRE